MKLYLVDDYQVYTYSLPNKIEDAFIINYIHYSGEDETITFFAKENKWMIESSSDVLFKKDEQEIQKAYLENDSIYTIHFSDLNDIVTLYCYDSHQKFFNFELGNHSEVVVGKGQNCNIIRKFISFKSLNFLKPL